MRLVQVGPRNAKIVFVGESPGDTEVATGIPFSGSSGNILNIMLGNSGILRNDCFITNLCHVQPQGPKKNDFDWFLKTEEGKQILLQGMIQLKEDLDEIRPNVVVALGAMPLRVLTGKVGIDKWRGSILPSTLVDGLKVIATYHPAFIIRSWDYKAVAEMDLRRIKKDANFPDLRHPKRELILNPSPTERRDIVEEMMLAEWLSIDIECWERENGTWQLACVGFSDRADRSLVIHNYGPADLVDIAKLCGSTVPDKVFQNGQFDYTVLKSEGITVNGFGEHIRENGKLVRVRGWDTMLAQHALYPECAGSEDEVTKLKGGTRKSAAIKKGLGFLVSINTREPFYKDDGKVWRQTNDLQMFWRYNALDAACTREIRDVQAIDLAEYGTMDVLQHEMSLLRPTMESTSIGFRIDTDLRSSMKSQLEVELMNLQNFLDGSAGKHINVLSNGINGDVGKLLYQDLGLPVKRHKDTGNPTADKGAITELAEKYGHPLILTILAIRERRKIIETYLDSSLDNDGRMRCNFNIVGTNTGRISSSASLSGSGQNLQNQPLKVRQLFVSDPGNVFVYRDYKQAEAWIVAFLARCPYLIDIFLSGRDIHTENAARIYNLRPEDVTPEMRFLAKKGIHSANYGVQAYTTAMFINNDAKDTWGKPGTKITITVADAQRVIDGYFMLAPEVKSVFWADIKRALNTNRTLTTPLGRKRTFFGRWESNDDSKFLNGAYSFPPQGGVGDLTTKAWVEMYYQFKAQQIPAQVLVNVHDSMMAQCTDDPEIIEATANTMSQAMAIPITIHGKTFTIPSDCKVGYNWMDRGKDGSNPRGLVDIEKFLANRTKVMVTV